MKSTLVSIGILSALVIACNGWLVAEAISGSLSPVWIALAVVVGVAVVGLLVYLAIAPIRAPDDGFDEPLREPIDPKRDRKQHEPHHEEGAVMGAAADHFAHLLRDDARHRVDGLKDCAETLREIGDSDPVSSTQKNDHRLTDHASETEQDRGHDSGKRCGHDHAPDRLKPVRA